MLVPAQAQAHRSETAGTWEERPYQAIGGKVDAGTYKGRSTLPEPLSRLPRAGQPRQLVRAGLIESLAQIGYEGYLEPVMYGIENVAQAEQSVMPAFAEVEEVVKHVDDIYSYLKARADGVIGRGRPERLPD
jgi:hypothetical protein